MENRKLTVKQKKFADEYIKTGNATLSAERAGYSKNTLSEIGYENLNKPHIKSYIDQRLDEIASKQIADAKEVLELLTSIARGEITEEATLLVGDGVQDLVPKRADVRDRIRAAELLGRRYSLFTDKVELEGNIGAVIIDDVPDEDE